MKKVNKSIFTTALLVKLLYAEEAPSPFWSLLAFFFPSCIVNTTFFLLPMILYTFSLTFLTCTFACAFCVLRVCLRVIFVELCVKWRHHPFFCLYVGHSFSARIQRR